MAEPRIATWDELRAHLRTRTLREVDADHLEVALGDPYARPELRVQLGRVSVHGAPWFELVAKIGSGRALPITSSLTNNGLSVIGAFCFADGAVALRQLLPLEGLLLTDLERALKVLAWRVVESQRQLDAS